MLWMVWMAALCVVGVGTAVAGAFVHPAVVSVLDIGVPYGLVLALAGLGALLVLAHAWAHSRVGKALVAAGWLLPVFVLSQARSAGDLVIAADVRGLVFLYGGVILIGIAVGLPVMQTSGDAGAADGVR